jgi:hypothetical protein
VNAAHGAADLRVLLEPILSLLESALQAAGTSSSNDSGESGKCTQTWCPFCALAAMTAGEPHPLLALIGEHGAELLVLIRAMMNTVDSTPQDGRGAGDPADEPPRSPGRYQHIPVTVHE